MSLMDWYHIKLWKKITSKLKFKTVKNKLGSSYKCSYVGALLWIIFVGGGFR